MLRIRKTRIALHETGEKKNSFVLKEKKGEPQIENLHTTKRKRKTAYDARDFVALFFGKAKISIFNDT